MMSETSLGMYQDLEQELEDLVSVGEQRRLNGRREMLVLRGELTSLQVRHKERRDIASGQGHLALYQQGIRDVFADDLPSPYVMKIQAQMCHSLHKNEIQLKQIHLLQKGVTNEEVPTSIVAYLQEEKAKLLEENDRRRRELETEFEDKQSERDRLEYAFQLKIQEQKAEIQKLQQKLGMVIQSPMSSPRQRLSDSLRHLVEIGMHHSPKMPAVPNLQMMAPMNAPKTPASLRNSQIWVETKEALERNDGQDSDTLDRSSQHQGRLKRLSMLRARSNSLTLSFHGGVTNSPSTSRLSFQKKNSPTENDNNNEDNQDDTTGSLSSPMLTSRPSLLLVGQSLRNLVIGADPPPPPPMDRQHDSFSSHHSMMDSPGGGGGSGGGSFGNASPFSPSLQKPSVGADASSFGVNFHKLFSTKEGNKEEEENGDDDLQLSPTSARIRKLAAEVYSY